MKLSTASEALWRAELHGLIATGRAREIRKAAGLPQSAIARTVGADVSTVHRWESGERRPSGEAAHVYYELLTKLARGQ